VKTVRTRQSGATLIVSLVMLAVLTVLVTSAFSMSSTDLKTVSNMQYRDESVAAANRAIEQVLSSPFTNAPTAESIDVDLNNDGRDDYRVDFAAPTCVSASAISVGGLPPSSSSLGSAFSISSTNVFQTVWDLNGEVVDNATGVQVRVRQGVRVLLDQAKFDAVCS